MVNAEGAIETLLNLMAIPAVLLTCFGGYYWYKGSKLGYENRVRAGKLLVMFGVILLVIVLILSFFIFEYRLIKSPGKS